MQCNKTSTLTQRFLSVSHGHQQKQIRQNKLKYKTAFNGGITLAKQQQQRKIVLYAAQQSESKAELKALIFDCDGVIVESEDLHRRAYNDAFKHFDIQCDGELVNWDVDFYEQLQNTIGGGKPKMKWYFGTHKNWPTSTFMDAAPTSDGDQAKLIDTIQDWKTQHYQDMIGSGSVQPRNGVLDLMDDAKQQGLQVAVCSASTKSSVVHVLNCLLGAERFGALDVFMAGDDVPAKKPDPSIYDIAAKKLGVAPSECVVIEDSLIGLQAARGAGMPCVITYTHSTRSQEFDGAQIIVSDLKESPIQVNIDLLKNNTDILDDRKV